MKTSTYFAAKLVQRMSAVFMILSYAVSPLAAIWSVLLLFRTVNAFGWSHRGFDYWKADMASAPWWFIAVFVMTFTSWIWARLFFKLTDLVQDRERQQYLNRIQRQPETKT